MQKKNIFRINLCTCLRQLSSSKTEAGPWKTHSFHYLSWLDPLLLYTESFWFKWNRIHDCFLFGNIWQQCIRKLNIEGVMDIALLFWGGGERETIISMFWWFAKQLNVLALEIILSGFICMFGNLYFIWRWLNSKIWPEMFHEKLYLSLYLNEIIWNADAKYNSLM